MESFTANVVGLGRRVLSARQGGILSGVPILEEHLSRFFVQATIILGITRFLSFFGTYMKQPKVIFEIIGGILLGPSAIGRHQAFLDIIFPESSIDFLDIVANIGLTLYLFLVGLELDPVLLKSHAKSAGGIAVIGMAVPFALGVAISRVMFDTLQGNDPEYEDVKFVSFFVFVGTAMSITAFPVLARLLKEGGLIYTPAGAMAMGAAALNDALAWCLLTLAISIANAGELATAGYIFMTVVGFALVLFLVVRPVFEKVVVYVESLHRIDMNQNLFVLTLCLVFMCAWTTALLGVHAIFGAFMFGLIVPRGSHLFKECNERMEELVVSFTLPLYFALSGLKTDVTTISTGKEGGITILVCFCATIGKFVGAGGTALANGMTLRESSVIAVLMNTRGLVELIVLNLGMSSGILSIRTFSVMVVMCLVTTFMTSPLIELIFPMEMRMRSLTDSKKGSAADPSETLEVSDADVVSHLLDKVSVDNFARVGVVVDAISKMQPMIRSIGFIAPQNFNSELCVTAMHFVEPTNSTRDEFLALNARGKLIRVDEESTDLEQSLRYMDDPSLKPPELLPMSVFCKALHMPVNAFRVQGDPDEFPRELRSLARHNDCDLLFMPFKPKSHYLQKLFWQTMHHVDVPTVMVALNEIDDDAADAIDAGKTGRARLDSGNSNSSKNDEPSSPNPRSASASEKLEAGSNYQQQHHHHHHHEVLYTNVPLDVLPAMRRTSVTARITKLPVGPRAPRVVVAVLLGELADIVIMSLLLKMAHSKHNEVHVLLPVDNEAYPQANLDAFAQFVKSAADEHVKLQVQQLSSLSTDYEGLRDEVTEHPFDLAIFSFVEPRDVGFGALQRENSVLSRGRAHTLSEVVVETIRHTPDPLELRLQTGMSHQCAHSALANPELGKLGSLLHDSQHAKQNMMWILHEPAKARMQLNAWGTHHVSMESVSGRCAPGDQKEGDEVVAGAVELVTLPSAEHCHAAV